LGVYDDGQWLQLIDGYDYKICSRRNISQKFMDISRRFDVFFFSLPDHDMSLNYAMYQHGQCVRSVWISSPKFTDQVIEKNTGELLRGEEQVIFGKDGQFLLDGGDSYKLSLLAIAEEMGANTNYTKSTFSFYRQSNSRSLNK
jgi:hypothetical protein